MYRTSVRVLNLLLKQRLRRPELLLILLVGMAMTVVNSWAQADLLDQHQCRRDKCVGPKPARIDLE